MNSPIVSNFYTFKPSLSEQQLYARSPKSGLCISKGKRKEKKQQCLFGRVDVLARCPDRP